MESSRFKSRSLAAFENTMTRTVDDSKSKVEAAILRWANRMGRVIRIDCVTVLKPGGPLEAVNTLATRVTDDADPATKRTGRSYSANLRPGG